MRRMMPTTWLWSWVKLPTMMGPEREMMVPPTPEKKEEDAAAAILCSMTYRLFRIFSKRFMNSDAEDEAEDVRDIRSRPQN